MKSCSFADCLYSATEISHIISRTRYSGRSPARAPIIERTSSHSEQPSNTHSRSSHEQFADYDAASYIQREGYSDQVEASSERESIREERFIAQRRFEADSFSHTADLPRTELFQRERNGIPSQGIGMATATMSSQHPSTLSPQGTAINAQVGHPAYNGAAGPMPSGSSGPAPPRARGQRQVGDWILGKTIGAGSMGKVKVVVHQHTKEKVSIKIPFGGFH